MFAEWKLLAEICKQRKLSRIFVTRTPCLTASSGQYGSGCMQMQVASFDSAFANNVAARNASTKAFFFAFACPGIWRPNTYT